MNMKRVTLLFIMIFFLRGTLFAQKMTVSDVDANVLMEINDEGSTGSITLPSGPAPTGTTDKLYNTGGVLYWNGSPLIPSQTGQAGKVLSTDGTSTRWRTHNVAQSDGDGGDSYIQITQNYAWYQNIMQVTLTTPGSGKVIVNATGSAEWQSNNWDLLLIGILRNSDPNASWDAENEWYRYLNILTDYNTPDRPDSMFCNFANHRGFNVGAGTQTFTLWANKYTSSAVVALHDVTMSAVYIPTGGTILAPEAVPDEEELIRDEVRAPERKYDISRP